MKRHEVLDFISKKLVFLSISGPPLTGAPVGRYLADFQKQIIKTAYKPDGTPSKNLFWGWMRKISKTMTASWFINYCLENKKGWRGVCVASTYDQSGHLYNLCRQQIQQNDNLDLDHYKLMKDTIINEKTDSQLSRVYSRASANLGNVKLSSLFADQLESWADIENYNSLESGMLMSQEQPHIFLLSNVPPFQSHWSIPFVQSKRKDPDFKFIEYGVPLNVPWESEKAKRVNPFYNLYKRAPKKHPHLKQFVRNMDKREREAKRSPETENSYRRYILGQKIALKDYQWVKGESLKTISLDKVKKWNARIVVGIDLSMTIDFSAGSIMFFDRNSEKVAIKPILHIADLSWRRQPQQVQFRQWAKQKFITIQSRKAVSPEQFLSDVDDFISQNKLFISQYCWDRGLVVNDLVKQYPKSSLYSGTAYQMAASVRFLEGKARQGDLYLVDDNACFRWMCDCARSSERSKGYVLLSRETNRQSIDGPVAACMGTKWILENSIRKPLFMSG